MENIDSTIATLHELSRMGLRISIDDFGTGHSSLGRLKHLPINTLKIDRSFVQDLANNPDDAAIVKAIIAMARSLNLQVVAEGVETPEQLVFLREQQCDKLQGYLFSRPISTEEFTILLQERTCLVPDNY
jgi:EAL domain-containing protein (putative c-di-GMP-specific phosphodiesterase class I)